MRVSWKAFLLAGALEMASTEGLPTSSVLAACAAEFCPAWGPHSTFAHRRAPAVHLPFSTDGSAPAPKLRQKATVHFDTVAFPFAEEVFDALVSGGTTGRLSASADDSLSRGGGSFQKTLQERGTLGKLHEAALATNPAKDPCKNGNLKLPKGNAGRNIMRRVRKIYYRFICEVVAPMISSESGDCDSVMFQSTPALRMVPPSRKQATHAHVDAMYFHQPGQINFWMPLSRVAGTNTLWVESLEGRGDFASLDLEYGQCARFYGNRRAPPRPCSPHLCALPRRGTNCFPLCDLRLFVSERALLSFSQMLALYGAQRVRGHARDARLPCAGWPHLRQRLVGQPRPARGRRRAAGARRRSAVLRPRRILLRVPQGRSDRALAGLRGPETPCDLWGGGVGRGGGRGG